MALDSPTLSLNTHQPSAMSRRKNTKKLSLTLSLPFNPLDPPHPFPTRRPSVISLPAPTTSLLHRKEDEGGSPTIPYSDGPIQIIPGIWLGSEDNARDWKGLVERGIRSILNVAKEVPSPFDAQPLRSTLSVPNLKATPSHPTYYPPHVPSGRPPMHYLKLQWSHGQKHLVNDGFQAGMVFTDAALARGDGVLVHCQCGISRSATMVIALVMRAAADRSPSVPPEVWDLKGMQSAYSFVKEKSKWIGPNMSLIYELLDYEKKLKSDSGSPGFSDAGSGATSEEEEWSRRRQLLDDMPSDNDDSTDRESSLVVQEARALDKAMEDRAVARKSSASSLASTSSGLGMGPAWRSRYSTRKRAGSIASNMTSNSFISENLVEEEEESQLLGVGGGFDDELHRGQSAENIESSATNSPDDEMDATPRRDVHPTEAFVLKTVPRLRRPPPSAPAWKKTFDIPPPPLTAVRSNFEFPHKPKPKLKRRPPPIGLPPVPSSPVTVVVAEQESNPAPPLQPTTAAQPASGLAAPPASDPTLLHSPSQSLPSKSDLPQRPPMPHYPASLPKFGLRQRCESRRLLPPPVHLLRKSSAPEPSSMLYNKNLPTTAKAHQTLFVFPPSPTLTTRTPSAVMLTTTTSTPGYGSGGGVIPFPTISTPRIATFRQHGRTRSFIGVGTPMTPTTAFTKVEARGYVGLE